MVYKNKERKINRLQIKRFVFTILLIVYCIGLAAGCAYAVKNSGQPDISNYFTSLSGGEKGALFRYTISSLCRDAVCICAVTVLKYSGILKGFCIGVPFVFSARNACVYTVALLKKQTSIFSLVFFYILRDSAVTFLVLALCYVTCTDIVQNRLNVKKDLRTLAAYLAGLFFVYIIDFAVKSVILPLQYR